MTPLKLAKTGLIGTKYSPVILTEMVYIPSSLKSNEVNMIPLIEWYWVSPY
jgi:hypothetical protein